MKQLVKKIIKKLLKPLPLQDIILFESHSDFCDNSRALYEYMISRELNKRYKMVWYVENPDKYRKHQNESVKFIQVNPKGLIEKIRYLFYPAVAKYAFYSHRKPPFKLNKGEVFVNLWHGTGLKNTNFCNLGLDFDYVLYSSDFYKKPYVKYLHCTEEQLLPFGNPRTDLLFSNSNELDKITDKHYNKIIIWMPTYRTHKNGFKSFEYVNKDTLELPVFTNINEIENMNDILRKNNNLLIIKLHPAQELRKIKFKSSANIKLLTNEDLDNMDIQLYKLLGETDALITDYSSVYVDYLLTGKPIAFTIDDMDDYKTGYIFDNPLDYMPGKHIENFDDFKEFILNLSESKDEYYEKRIHMNNILNKYKDGYLSRRIVEYFNIE